MVMDEVAIAKLKGTCITAASHYTELTNKECCFRQSRLHKPTIQICARDKHLRFANPKGNTVLSVDVCSRPRAFSKPL
jgi:hypothetical protein